MAERDVVPARVADLVGEDRRRPVGRLPLRIEEAVAHGDAPPPLVAGGDVGERAPPGLVLLHRAAPHDHVELGQLDQLPVALPDDVDVVEAARDVVAIVDGARVERSRGCRAGRPPAGGAARARTARTRRARRGRDCGRRDRPRSGRDRRSREREIDHGRNARRPARPAPAARQAEPYPSLPRCTSAVWITVKGRRSDGMPSSMPHAVGRTSPARPWSRAVLGMFASRPGSRAVREAGRKGGGLRVPRGLACRRSSLGRSAPRPPTPTGGRARAVPSVAARRAPPLRFARRRRLASRAPGAPALPASRTARAAWSSTRRCGAGRYPITRGARAVGAADEARTEARLVRGPAAGHAAAEQRGAEHRALEAGLPLMWPPAMPATSPAA